LWSKDVNTTLAQASQSRNRQELEISIASAIFAMTRAQFVRIHTLLSVAGEKLSVVSSQVDATGVYSIADSAQGTDWTASAELLGDHPLMSSVVSNQASVRRQESSTGLHHCFYPITLHGEVRGIVEIKENHRPYQDEDALISGFIALYINYAHFLDGSTLDPLTGLLKEEHLVPGLQQILEGAEQAIKENKALQGEVSGAGYCLSIVAIDHFKEINQLYGHLFGDEIRRRIASELSKWFKTEAQLFFMASDEFVVLLPALASRQVESCFSQFLEHMTTQEFPNIGQLTLSVGLSQLFLPDTPQQILGRARLALSKAQSLNTKVIRRPGAR
jgi:diguanylate cyclase (GGDEF)-like protein